MIPQHSEDQSPAELPTHVVAGVPLSNPDRVQFPEQGITKLDLARYYEAVGDWILPHVVNRPLSVVRCPRGRAEKCFFQKHIGKGMAAPIKSVDVPEANDMAQYIAIDDLAGLVTLIQLGVLELHPWGSRNDRLDRPDRMILDLDPGEGVTWDAIRDAAANLRERLQQLGLESLLRTTGGKGLHVVVPLVRRNGWDEIKATAQALAEAMVRDEPERYVASASKSKRSGKIYVDYLRNSQGATAVASYSTRARSGAPVAVPLRWDELARLESSAHYNIANVPQRLASLGSDPWNGFFDVNQSVTRQMMKELSVRL